MKGTRLAEERIVRIEREILHIRKLVLHAVGGIWSRKLSEVLLIHLEHADLREVLSRMQSRHEEERSR